MRLWPALRKASGARVVAVSAWAHSRAPMMFEDPNFEHREYVSWMAYGQSKTANILFALALDERGKAHGVRAFSLHPGSIVSTGLSKYVAPELLRAAGLVGEDGNPIIDPAKNMKTVEQGAATSVWCATSPQLDGMGGVYCHNCDIAPLVSETLAANPIGSMALGVMPHAVDPQAADRLWSLSEQLTGVSLV
jgi:NAD(P)-dependent dehydrogenase (short-subunit alcohol dehydrogenase family)